MEPVNHLYLEISELIISARQRVAVSVNSEAVVLHWQIGHAIKRNVLHDQRAEYGKEIIKGLAERLTLKFGTGFSRTNLLYFVQFVTKFPDFEIVHALRGQFSWTHFRIFLTIEKELERQFYMELCRIERWNTRQLQDKIDSALFLRTALSKKPEELIKRELDHLAQTGQVTPDIVFRDPYILNFLGYQDAWLEKDLEDGILRELQNFILEIGADFAFLARQKHILVDGKDFRIDLLFFHRRLRCLVVIDLKIRQFKPGDKSQMELYLRWLDKYERQPGENEPIGLILCAGKADEQIELLMLDKGNIRVSEYLTELPPKEILQSKLHEAVQKARESHLP